MKSIYDLDCVNNTDIDLHMHSLFSDGDMSPQDIVDMNIENGLEVMAITDHDGIDGSIVACSYVDDKPIIVIPGIEFDSEDPLGKELHILGYHINYDSPDLRKVIDQARKWRDDRNDKLFKLLVDQGYNIDWEQINASNGGIFVGKPNFARALIDNGYAKDVGDVFRNIISPICHEAGLEKKTHFTSEIIDTIHKAGGVAVMAHPIEQYDNHKNLSLEDFYKKLYLILDRMREYGIDGIECFHPSANCPNEPQMLVKYAREHDLLITRGTDFHSNLYHRNYKKCKNNI